MRRNLLLATSMVAGLAGFAGAASAATVYADGFNIVAGGSSLAANLYNRTAQAIATANNVGANVLTEGTNTVGATTGATQGEFLYNPDGSGSGQKGFITQAASVHGYASGLAVDGVTTATIGAVHLGASDAYLTASQLACWNNGSATTDCTANSYTAPTVAPYVAGGPLIQLPSFGTAIVIAHTNNYSKFGTLDDNDLCGIFSGKITDWAGVETKPSGTAKAAQGGAITVVYREDGSGTSFLFTQHLARVCNSGNTAAGVTFTATKYFADVFGTAVTAGSLHTIGAGLTASGTSFIYGSGSGAIADALSAGVNLVGYLTPDFTSIASTALSHYAKVAALLGTSINDSSVDPSQSPYQYIHTAKVWNSHEGKAYPATPGAASKGLTNPNVAGGDFSPGYPTTKTNALNPLLWIPAVADPLLGYPIVGYTTLELPTCYSNAKISTYVKAFLTQLYSATNKTNLTSEGFTAVPSGYTKTIQSVFITGKSSYGINIGNTNVCNSRGLSTTHAGL